MDSSELRRELVTSVRLLVGAERRLLAGLLVGSVGYLVWLTGTGVAVSRTVETLLGSASVDPWSTGASVLAATFALLWVVAPSALAVRGIVGALTNLRGNVEQHYRVEKPIVLLVPPAVLLGAAVAVAAVGNVDVRYVLALGGVATALLLVRTVAYGYRAFSFSHPRLLQALVFVAAVGASLAAVTRTGSLTGQEALVEAVADRYGVADVAFGTTTTRGVTAPTLPLTAVLAPGVLAFGYVLAQLVASLVVRVHSPDVPRSDIRAGQRYPDVVRPQSTRHSGMGSGSESGSGPTDDSGGDPGSGGGDGDEGSPASDDSGDSEDGDERDRVGHTRVYTPPENDEADRSGDADGSADASGDAGDEPTGLDGSGDGGAVKNELCPVCGAFYEADTDRTHCPNCNAVIDSESSDLVE